MEEMLQNGHLELRFLCVSGKNISVLYNIKYRNKIYFYQAGLDISFDRSLSPGLLLHAHSIEEAIKDGVEEYDFLAEGSMDSYKERWSKECKYLCDIYMARARIVKFTKYWWQSARYLRELVNKLR